MLFLSSLLSLSSCPLDSFADGGAQGLVRCERTRDLPGPLPLVPAQRRGRRLPGSDVGRASAAHEPVRDVERGAPLGPPEPRRPAGRHTDTLREPRHGPQLQGHAQ